MANILHLIQITDVTTLAEEKKLCSSTSSLHRRTLQTYNIQSEFDQKSSNHYPDDTSISEDIKEAS